MPTITLEVPTADTVVAAGLHAANYADLQALLNGGLDAANLDPAYAATLGGASPLVPVTSLPGSPANGQQALLVDSLTAPTYAWLLQYNTSISDAHKWVFIGGSSLQGASGVTVPRAGNYEVLWGGQADASGTSPSNAIVTFGVGAGTITGQTTAELYFGSSSGMTLTIRSSLTGRCRWNNATVGAAATLGITGGAGGSIAATWLFIRPIRVS